MDLRNTYLLGAGASAGALAVVAQLAEKIREVFGIYPTGVSGSALPRSR